MKNLSNIFKAVLVLIVELVLFYFAWNVAWWIICKIRLGLRILKNLIFKPAKGDNIPEEEDKVVEE